MRKAVKVQHFGEEALLWLFNIHISPFFCRGHSWATGCESCGFGGASWDGPDRSSNFQHHLKCTQINQAGCLICICDMQIEQFWTLTQQFKLTQHVSVQNRFTHWTGRKEIQQSRHACVLWSRTSHSEVFTSNRFDATIQTTRLHWTGCRFATHRD